MSLTPDLIDKAALACSYINVIKTCKASTVIKPLYLIGLALVSVLDVLPIHLDLLTVSSALQSSLLILWAVDTCILHSLKMEMHV